MNNELRDWLSLSALLGTLLAFGGGYVLWTGTLPQHHDGLEIAACVGIVLLVVAFLFRVGRERVETLLTGMPQVAANRRVSRPRTTLFLASFAALFLELVLIRYTGSQLRIFSFFKNVPLVAVYLGLGLGCALREARPRHLLMFLLWLLPLTIVLAEGSFLFAGTLGHIAATASSEQILGDAAVRATTPFSVVAGQAAMGAFCLLTLLALASLFVPIGRLLGDAFEPLPRLTAYTVNIGGSLAGTGVFLILGYLWTAPWLWMVIGLAPLLWWIDDVRQRRFAAVLMTLIALSTAPRIGETIWSPYQKLVGQSVTVGDPASGRVLRGYLVDISDVFYQIAVDLRTEAVARAGWNPYPHYDAAFQNIPRPLGRVLIVGSGTGNDVAAALRAGATSVDAVDIDPAIVSLGRRHHPEMPYSDPRVHVIVDDARAAFRKLSPGTYDAVLFGLLDSHTQLGMSSVRLDNYVFTLESFEEARSLLRPGGRIVLTAATFREWFRERFVRMLEAVCASDVQTREVPDGSWVSYDCRVSDRSNPSALEAAAHSVPTDDWPFLYLPKRGIPQAYLFVVILLAFGSVVVIRRHGLPMRGLTAFDGHLFFLGAAFLLMEVYAINRLALLFGTTWIVSAVTIMVVLTLIVAANFTVLIGARFSYAIAYAGLFGSLLLSYSLNPEAVIGRGIGPLVIFSIGVLLPVYFAALVFARSFASSAVASVGIGVNMLGAVVGGWAEYSSMAFGIRSLVLLATAFYIGSLISLVWARTSAEVRILQPSTSNR